MGVTTEIAAITPQKIDHIGKALLCSLVCSRTYESPEDRPAQPALYYVTFKNDERWLLVDLPTEAFWGLRSELRNERLGFVEVRYNRPRYGSGQLISLYFPEMVPPSI